MFKSLNYFSNFNLPMLPKFFDYIPNEILEHDFSNINSDELIIFCEENKEYLKNSYNNLSDDNLISELKKEFILNNIREQIPKLRLNALLSSNKPYCYDELKSLNVNEDGLITLEDYFHHSRKNPYMLCLPISDTNSNYWIWKELYDLKDNDNISIKIRLDPLVKSPLPIINKMTVFSEPLNWNLLSEIKDKNCASFIDDDKGNKTDLFWQKSDNEIHFKCEELPLYEEIKVRGSRYFHAIYDMDNEVISHCDGSIKIYDENDFLKRNDISLWENNSKNYGKYLKIFQVDGEINSDRFTSLITSFFVRNHDIRNYFENFSNNLKC